MADEKAYGDFGLYRGHLLATDLFLIADKAADATGATGGNVASSSMVFKNAVGGFDMGPIANAFRPSNFGYSATYKVMIIGQTGTALGTATLSLGVDPSTVAGASFEGDGREILVRRNTRVLCKNAAETDWLNVFTIENGNIAFGTTNITSFQRGFAVEIYASGGYSRTITGHPSGTASGNAYAMFLYNASAIGSITQNGTTGVLYNTTSDVRVKENIAPVDITAAGSIIDGITIVSYDMRRDGAHEPFGIIAQDLHETIPQVVKPGDEGPLYVNEDDPELTSEVAGEGFVQRADVEIWGYDPGKLVPLLIAEIQHLRQRMAALEAE